MSHPPPVQPSKECKAGKRHSREVQSLSNPLCFAILNGCALRLVVLNECVFPGALASIRSMAFAEASLACGNLRQTVRDTESVSLSPSHSDASLCTDSLCVSHCHSLSSQPARLCSGLLEASSARGKLHSRRTTQGPSWGYLNRLLTRELVTFWQ